MRVLLYSPDSYGLGHVRRSISVARAILGRMPNSSALILTGAPRAHYFDYPERCDFLKLPSITKNEAGTYVCRDLDMSIERAVEFRSQLIRTSAASYQAQVLLVDHSPIGLCGEILPTLRDLGESPRRTLRILGMRDLIDEPASVRAAWKKHGVIDVLRNCYDHILVYGQRDLFDPVEAYGIPDDVARKLTFVGYIPRNGHRASPVQLKQRYAPRTGRLVVITLGGGGDGNLVLRSFFEGYERLGPEPPFEVAAVSGPLMSPRRRERFKVWAEGLPGLSFVEYTDSLPDLLEGTDFVVSMGGYNTTCELACAGARALIVPRTFPRKEQLLRARILSERGVCRMLVDDRPDPDRLMREVLDGLERVSPAPGWGLDFSGLDEASAVIDRLCHASSTAEREPI